VLLYLLVDSAHLEQLLSCNNVVAMSSNLVNLHESKNANNLLGSPSKVSLIVKTHITKVEIMVKQLGDLALQQPKVIVVSKFLSDLPPK